MGSVSTSPETEAAGALRPISFLELFEAYSDHIPSPEIFRKWTAVSMLAGAMERRCYTRTARGPLYPTLFILLVSPPGVGKSVAIDEAADLLSATGQFNIGSHGLTKAALVDALREKPRTMIVNKTEMIQYHSLLINSEEFGVLVPAHDLEFLNTLNQLFDCGRTYSVRTRSLGELKIDYPHINLIAGTQPKYLSEILPEAAFGMGFTSRIIMVYAGSGVEIDVFSAPKKVEAERLELIRILQSIAEAHGEFHWSPEAMEEFEVWHRAGCPIKPTHPKLQNYNARRFTHVIKMAMAFSISERKDLLVEAKHFLAARDLLLSTEALMPEIFREMTSRGYGDAAEETFNFIWTQHIRTKQEISEAKIVHFLQSRVPANQIAFTLDSMIRAGQIKLVKDTGTMKYYIPLQMHLHGGE